MHDDRRIVEDRIRRFVDKRLNGAVYVDSAPLTVTAWAAPGEPVPFAEAVGQDFHEITHGTPWGPPWSTMWLHVTGTVPPSWRGRDEGSPEMRVELGFTGGPGFNAEGLVYRPDGTVVKGIAPRNAFVPIDNPDGPVDFYIEAAANPDIGKYFWSPMPLGDKATSGEDALYRLGDVDLALRDLNLWGLQQDIATLDGLMHTLPEDLPRRHEILRALERMLDTVDPDDLAGTAAAGREQLADVLARPAYASAHRITAVGHAHIDSAWLWPVRETVRKCARTFSNMVDLMDRHPDFRFACSSAQQYAWIKDKYPSLFARIKEKVAAGQFIPVGGMWVEADTNMPGAEAMARQFVMGKRFFLDEFGIDTPEVWLPDSFGYSAAMPQIVAASGSEYFLTQKISWNSANRMPHHTFIWEGIDGTGVFTHFPPVDTYNSDLGGEILPTPSATIVIPARGPCRWCPLVTETEAAAPPVKCSRTQHESALWRDRRRSPWALPRSSSRTRGPNMPTRHAGPVSCIWNCTAARIPLRPTPSRATGAANIYCARPSCGRPRPRCAPASNIRTPSSTRSGSWCCCSSSTTSCPVAPSHGCTRTPSATTRRSPTDFRPLSKPRPEPWRVRALGSWSSMPRHTLAMGCPRWAHPSPIGRARSLPPRRRADSG